MARGRRHVRLLLLLPALLLAQGSSCLDFLDDPGADAGPSGPQPCCVVCVDDTVPCGDACVAADAACDEELGCACDDVPPEGSACSISCSVEADCGFRPLVACIGESCRSDGARVAPAGDACLEDAADCGEAATCACDGGCERVDACTGSEDATCFDTCATLVGQEPVATFQENRCRIESTCEDLALCTQSP